MRMSSDIAMPIRRILRREKPVTLEGEHYSLPYHGPGSVGLGKPLKLTVHPLRSDIPIYLAAEGPKNIAMAGELCDGWLALFYSPHHDGFYRKALEEGFARPAARHGSDDFEVAATVPLIVTDDLQAAPGLLRRSGHAHDGGHVGPVEKEILARDDLPRRGPSLTRARRELQNRLALNVFEPAENDAVRRRGQKWLRARRASHADRCAPANAARLPTGPAPPAHRRRARSR